MMTDRQTDRHKHTRFQLIDSAHLWDGPSENIKIFSLMNPSMHSVKNTIRGFKEIQFPQCWCDAWLQTDADLQGEKSDLGLKRKYSFPSFGAMPGCRQMLIY